MTIFYVTCQFIAYDCKQHILLLNLGHKHVLVTVLATKILNNIHAFDKKLANITKIKNKAT